MKTASKSFRSPGHLLKLLISVNGKRKHLDLIDSFDNGGDSFQIEIHDDFIDDDIKELEMKLLDIKKKLSDMKK